MDKSTLVDSYIDGGLRLLRRLDANTDLNISCALWYYFSDTDKWKLLFSFSKLDDIGPLKAYSIIQHEYILEQDNISIPFELISLISPKHRLIRLLRSTMKTGSVILGIRFTGNVINGFLIEDAYLYRVK